MTEMMLLCGALFYAPRLVLIRNPLDFLSVCVLIFQAVRIDNTFSQTVARRLSVFAAAAMCCVCLFTLFRNTYFDMGLLLSFLYWLALGCYLMLQDQPCIPQEPMI